MYEYHMIWLDCTTVNQTNNQRWEERGLRTKMRVSTYAHATLHQLLDGVDADEVGVPRLEAVRRALDYDHVVSHFAHPFTLGIR